MGSRRRTIALAVGIGALTVAIGGWLLAGHETPTGQPPLADLTPITLESFKASFNEASNHTRVVLLLSPT